MASNRCIVDKAGPWGGRGLFSAFLSRVTMAKGKKKKRDNKNKKEASGNSKRSAHDTHVAVMLSKAAKDRRLFDKYVAAGAGMQGGARAQTMDFLELHMVLQHIEVIPDYLAKDDAYEIFHDFLEELARNRAASSPARNLKVSGALKVVSAAKMFGVLGASVGNMSKLSGVPEASADRVEVANDATEKGKKSNEELDFITYGQFMLHLQDKLGLSELLARDRQAMQEHMEHLRLRCAVSYDFSYGAPARPRSLPQIDRRALVSDATLFDVESPAHVSQHNFAAPLVPACSIPEFDPKVLTLSCASAPSTPLLHLAINVLASVPGCPNCTAHTCLEPAGTRRVAARL